MLHTTQKFSCSPIVITIINTITNNTKHLYHFVIFTSMTKNKFSFLKRFAINLQKR